MYSKIAQNCFVKYSRRTSNYLSRIVLFDVTHAMSMVDLVAISVWTPKIDNVCSLMFSLN